MSMDERDIEWRCGCGHANPDYTLRCNGCGEKRYEPHPSERQEWMRRSQDMLLTLGLTEDLTDDAIDGYEIGLTAEQFVAAMIVLPRKST